MLLASPSVCYAASMTTETEYSVDVAANLAAVQARVDAAAKDVGRDQAPGFGGVSLIAVSKSHPASAARAALDAGHRVFGENRVQEAQEKWPPLKSAFPDAEVHLIGPLQTNKTADAVELFDVIQTLDREKLARALAKEMDRLDRRPALFVQINTGEELQKAGVLPLEADGFIEKCRTEFDLPVVGLMCIPPMEEAHKMMIADFYLLLQK